MPPIGAFFSIAMPLLLIIGSAASGYFCLTRAGSNIERPTLIVSIITLSLAPFAVIFALLFLSMVFPEDGGESSSLSTGSADVFFIKLPSIADTQEAQRSPA